MDITMLQRSLSLFNNDIERRKGERDAQIAIVREKEAEFLQCSINIELFEKVIKVYQLASTYARVQAKSIMERLTTSALSCVYPDDMKMEIDMNEEAGKAEAELTIITQYDGYTVENDAEDGDAGGVSDVVSLATRVSLLESAKPYQDGPLVLDEPGKHLGLLNRNLAPFLDMVSTSFLRQIIMITHDPFLGEAAHRAFDVIKKDGVSIVKQI